MIKYNWIKLYSNGNYLVELNGKYGLLSSDFKVLLEIKYDWIELLDNGSYKITLINNENIIAKDELLKKYGSYNQQ